MSNLERAIAIAVEAHAGQVDKGGAPYILHPLRVMLKCAPQHMAVAVLHDVIEDSDAWSPGRLLDEGFSEQAVAALVALTRNRGESYEAFIQRVKLNPIARLVKIEDLRDNMDLSRIAFPGHGDSERVRKYARALHDLSSPPLPARDTSERYDLARDALESSPKRV